MKIGIVIVKIDIVSSFLGIDDEGYESQRGAVIIFSRSLTQPILRHVMLCNN